jgi:hypothetical protein
LIACAFLGNDNLCLLAGLVWSYEVRTTGRIAVRLEGLKERKETDRDALIIVARSRVISYHHMYTYTHAVLVRAFLLCCPADQGAGLQS